MKMIESRPHAEVFMIRCPRCDGANEVGDERCANCDMDLTHAENIRDNVGERPNSSFFGWPRFLRKQKPDWLPPPVSYYRTRWPTWLSLLAAGLLLAAYWKPLVGAFNRLLGTDNGEITIIFEPTNKMQRRR